jgi:hypothetical protein
MTTTVQYQLNDCVRGWSEFYTNPLDIRKIINISYHKRLFCLWDSEYKYSVTITYSNPRSVNTNSPVITLGGNVGMSLTTGYRDKSIMTVRYKTENEVLEVIDNINKRKNLINIYDRQKNEELDTFISGQISA